MYGDGSATFTSEVRFNSPYWQIDGQVGQGAGALYGVPSSDGWMTYVEHGFKFLNNQKADKIQIYTDNIVIRHAELGFTNTVGSASAWGNSDDLLQIYPHHTNITISYCWLHDASRVNIAAQNPTNFIVEYSVIERCGQAKEAGTNDEHTELYSQQNGGTNTHFRYNLLRDWKSTGGLILHSETGTAAAKISTSTATFSR